LLLLVAPTDRVEGCFPAGESVPVSSDARAQAGLLGESELNRKNGHIASLEIVEKCKSMANSPVLAAMVITTG
jgi:hypothetical protein